MRAMTPGKVKWKSRFRRLKDYERFPKTRAVLQFAIFAILMLVKAFPGSKCNNTPYEGEVNVGRDVREEPSAAMRRDVRLLDGSGSASSSCRRDKARC